MLIKKEGQAGDQPCEDDADVSNPNIEENNNEDERAVPVGQAENQPPEKLTMIKRKAKEVFNPLNLMQTSATPVLMHLISLMRMITMMVTGLCCWHPIFPPNLTQRTSTRYWVSP